MTERIARRETVKELAYETVECWRCGEDRYTYESCMNCGASCKPLTKAEQREGETDA